MTLKIISAQEIVFQGEVSSVTLPGTMGAFTVLNNHASLVSTLAPGKITTPMLPASNRAKSKAVWPMLTIT